MRTPRAQSRGSLRRRCRLRQTTKQCDLLRKSHTFRQESEAQSSWPEIQSVGPLWTTGQTRQSYNCETAWVRSNLGQRNPLSTILVLCWTTTIHDHKMAHSHQLIGTGPPT